MWRFHVPVGRNQFAVEFDIFKPVVRNRVCVSVGAIGFISDTKEGKLSGEDERYIRR